MPFLQMAAARAEGEARLKGRRRKERTILALEMGIPATKKADARYHFRMSSADGEVRQPETSVGPHFWGAQAKSCGTTS